MPKPYSIDLRERVVAAVETGGLSRRAAASRRLRSSSWDPRWAMRGPCPRYRRLQCLALECFSACLRALWVLECSCARSGTPPGGLL